MSIIIRIARLLINRADGGVLLGMAGAFSDALVERFTPSERVILVRRFLEENLPKWLEGMSREEKVSLMNSLLPLMVREFPLGELDILGVFAAPPDVEHH